jgi:hypothetical protein
VDDAPSVVLRVLVDAVVTVADGRVEHGRRVVWVRRRR